MTDVTGYDAVTWENIPHTAKCIMVYGNGTYAVARTAVQARYPGVPVKMIDVNATDPGNCGILDVERYDATPEQFPGWVRERQRLHPGALCRAYMSLDTWPQVKEYAAELDAGQLQHVRYWVADWTGRPHIPEGAAACQYASTAEFDVSLVDYTAFLGS